MSIRLASRTAANIARRAGGASLVPGINRAAQAQRLAAPALVHARRLLSTQAAAARSIDDDNPQALLDAIASLSTADRTTLLNLLRDVPGHEQAPAQVEPRRDLATNEAARVQVFEAASPSVAFVTTAVDQPTSFWNGFPVGAGSGFVWDAEHIVTNYHVVAGGRARRGSGSSSGGKLPRRVQVKLHGQEEHVDAEVVGYEADKDLCVLKVDPSKLRAPLQPVPVAASAEIKVGQSVLAIGAPFGLDRTLTSGIVSALGRDIQGAGGRPIRDCIQTDAAINPGNSGGPLLDSHGRLVGVNTMIYAPNGLGGNVGIGFAVPSDTVSRVVTQILTHGPNARPSLGVNVHPDGLRQRLSRQLMNSGKLQRELDGALVAQVVPGGPAEALALKPFRPDPRGGGAHELGDLITAINGHPVKRNEDLLCAVEEAEADEPLSLTLMRECDPARLEAVTVTPVRRQALMASFGELQERAASEATRDLAFQRMRKSW